MIKHFDSLQKDYLGGPIVALNLIGPNRGLEKTLYETQDIVMMETNLLGSNDVDYFHFDFHTHCSSNSDPMMNFLRSVVLPPH